MVTLDVLIEILSRLSPEHLLRFKSVSKFWYALINDPKFIAKHLSISPQHKHLLLNRLVTDSEENELVFSILKFPLDRSMSVLDVHFPFHDDYKHINLHGHSHGLICVSVWTGILFLCNPATRLFRKLPPSNILLDEIQNKPEGDYSTRTLISSVTGFGYDARSMDFKVVTVWNFSDECYRSSPQRVEIYDMSKDRWREIEPLISDGNFSMAFVFHEGKFYWLGFGNEWIETILTFDISDEVFSEISLPESYGWNSYSRSLGILNGSIVLFNYPFRDVNEKIFDIWEMQKDESGTILWSKLLTIDPNCGILFPMLFVSSNELLIECKEGKLILYNIETQQFIELPIKSHSGIITNSNRYEASFFVKSMLSVERKNNMNYEF